jgi:hypothetical protein
LGGTQAPGLDLLSTAAAAATEWDGQPHEQQVQGHAQQQPGDADADTLLYMQQLARVVQLQQQQLQQRLRQRVGDGDLSVLQQPGGADLAMLQQLADMNIEFDALQQQQQSAGGGPGVLQQQQPGSINLNALPQGELGALLSGFEGHDLPEDDSSFETGDELEADPVLDVDADDEAEYEDAGEDYDHADDVTDAASCASSELDHTIDVVQLPSSPEAAAAVAAGDAAEQQHTAKMYSSDWGEGSSASPAAAAAAAVGGQTAGSSGLRRVMGSFTHLTRQLGGFTIASTAAAAAAVAAGIAAQLETADSGGAARGQGADAQHTGSQEGRQAGRDATRRAAGGTGPTQQESEAVQQQQRQAAGVGQMPDRQPPGLYSRQQYARQLYGGQQDGASSTGSADEDLEAGSDADSSTPNSWREYVTPELADTIHELQDFWKEREQHGLSPYEREVNAQQQQQQPLLSLEQLRDFRPSRGKMLEALHEEEAVMDWVGLIHTAAGADEDTEKAVHM